MARLFRRLSDYNSILLLVDGAMLPYEAGERKRKEATEATECEWKFEVRKERASGKIAA